MLSLALTLALTLVLPSPAHAIERNRAPNTGATQRRYNERWADRWEFLDPRAPNLVSVDAVILGSFAGVGLGYHRGLGRHASVGARFEYMYPKPGYGQLIGFAHTLELTGWIKRPWNGLFVSVGMTLGHQLLFRLPELHTLALGATVSVGWSWDVTAHVNLGISGGLRRMGVFERSTEICTLPGQCILTDEEFRPRFALTFAYRF